MLHDIMVGVTNRHPHSYHPFPGGYKLCNTLVGQVRPGATVTLTCRAKVRGRYVVIQQPGKHRNLGFCEVAVYTYTERGEDALILYILYTSTL